MAIALPPPLALPSHADFPPLLRMQDGAPVTDAGQWSGRRAELVQLVQHYEYGYLPQTPAQPAGVEVLFEDSHWLGGKGILKEVSIAHTPGAEPCRVLLASPPREGSRSAVFVGLNFHGNHTVCVDPRIALPPGWVPNSGPGAMGNRAGEVGRRAKYLPLPYILERGYAVATVYHGDFRPDTHELPGIEPFVTPSPLRDHDTEPGAIAIWAWGLMRVIDWLQTEPQVDHARIAVYGHSRNGKAALLTGALDQRVAVTIDCQSGCSGSAPARHGGREDVETIARINKSFPHWFDRHYKQFGEDPSCLPFDQHALIALCAPRPALVSCAENDVWANPPGQYHMARLASDVYRLLGHEGVMQDEPPQPDALLPSRLGYAIRRGCHNMGCEEWSWFLDFADRWL